MVGDWAFVSGCNTLHFRRGTGHTLELFHFSRGIRIICSHHNWNHVGAHNFLLRSGLIREKVSYNQERAEFERQVESVLFLESRKGWGYFILGFIGMGVLVVLNETKVDSGRTS